MIFIKAFFAALFTALRAYAREERIRRDYEEALRMNVVFEETERIIAGANATAKRISHAEDLAETDVANLRAWLRSRDPGVK